MSKDLEKEYLADLDHYDESMGIHSTSYQKCKERLIRLAKIDSANPNKALERLESYINNIVFSKDLISQKQQLLTDIATIKQALLKAQKEGF